MAGRMGRKLSFFASHMQGASDEVASAAGEVSGTSQSLAEGASEQAASIEATSGSLEEMSSMTRQNAENAGQADSLMKEANATIATAEASASASEEMNSQAAQMTAMVDELVTYVGGRGLNRQQPSRQLKPRKAAAGAGGIGRPNSLPAAAGRTLEDVIPMEDPEHFDTL